MTSIKIKPVLFIGKKYSDNKSPIFIRLTLNRKVVYLSVGKSAKPENWDSENNNVYEKAPKITPQHKAKLSEKEYLRLKDKYKRAEVLKDAIKINSDIDSKIKEVEGKEKELEVLKKPITLKIIKDEIASPQLPAAGCDEQMKAAAIRKLVLFYFWFCSLELKIRKRHNSFRHGILHFWWCLFLWF